MSIVCNHNLSRSLPLRPLGKQLTAESGNSSELSCLSLRADVCCSSALQWSVRVSSIPMKSVKSLTYGHCKSFTPRHLCYKRGNRYAIW